MVTDLNPPAVLILRARGGSDAALGELLELYRSYLHLLAEMQISRRLKTKVDASDVVQEAFLRVQAGFADFVGNSEGELVVWLRRILARRWPIKCGDSVGQPSGPRRWSAACTTTSTNLRSVCSRPSTAPVPRPANGPHGARKRCWWQMPSGDCPVIIAR